MRYILIILFSSVLFSSCYKEKTISDKDLEMILHDMFLQNAYAEENKLKLDTLNMYAPIFKKYGYKEEDMLRTLTLFTRRKSSRFSVVLDRTAERLERERRGFKHQVDMLDTVRNIADRRYGRLVYQDSLINIKSKKDAEAATITLSTTPGRYVVSYKYKFDKDSVKKNFSVKAEFYGLDTLGKRHSIRSMWLSTSNVRDVNIELEITEGVDSLKGGYLWFPNHVQFAPVVVDSVKVMYYLPEKIALDSLLRSYINYQLKFDALPLDSLSYEQLPQDSLPLPADSTGFITPSDSLSRSEGADTLHLN